MWDHTTSTPAFTESAAAMCSPLDGSVGPVWFTLHLFRGFDIYGQSKEIKTLSQGK